MHGERTISGLACGDVLAALDRFLDGTLDATSREAAAAHVAECDQCARFGGTYAEAVKRLRQGAAREAPDASVLDRLRSRLDALGPR
jgi:anti-sigma factor RsiW